MPDSPQLPWTDEQWATVQRTVHESARKARVAGSFLPLVGPLPDGQASVPALPMGQPRLKRYRGEARRRLEVDDGQTLRLTTIAVVTVVALRIAGLTPRTLAVGGAFTAVVVGLAAYIAYRRFVIREPVTATLRAPVIIGPGAALEYRRILVPVKPGRASEEAIDLACRLAAERRARIAAVSVVVVPLELPQPTRRARTRWSCRATASCRSSTAARCDGRAPCRRTGASSSHSRDHQSTWWWPATCRCGFSSSQSSLATSCASPNVSSCA